MCCSRTKRRKIRAKVEEHLKALDCQSGSESESITPEKQTSRADEQHQIARTEQFESVAVSADVLPELDQPIAQSSTLKDVCSLECNFSDSESHLRSQLTEWVTAHNISHTALSDLLKILRQTGLDLPKDPRTLLLTPQSHEVKHIAGGSYYHFGLASAIASELIHHELHKLPDSLSFHINIDGLPLFKSSNVQLWPILGKLSSVPKSHPFLIGLYSGVSKPSSVQEYLQAFIDDVKSACLTGLDFNGKHFTISLPTAFVCDAPARAYIKCVKGHTGYYSCERCTQKGVYINGRMSYPEISAPLRSDRQFAEMEDQEHHTGVSPLIDLGIGLVTTFVLDYMHLICLGVVRKLIYLWLKGPLRCRLSVGLLRVISEQMKFARQYFPRTFCRRPRSLLEVAQWKATEFRQFLLYTGPVVLCNNLPNDKYLNFLVLSVSVRILLSPTLCVQYCDYSENLLKYFVENFAHLYGQEFLAYNVHSLIHLAQDARRFGPLDNVSCFPFENFLGKLKKMVKRPQNPVQQIVRRVNERHKVRRRKCTDANEKHYRCHPTGPVPSGYENCLPYKDYRDKDTFISCSAGNNCFEHSGRVALVKNILQSPSGRTYVVCQYFDKYKPFFDHPLDSSCLGIKMVSGLTDQLQVLSVTDVARKIILLPFRDCFVALPLLHDC